jgi:branched-chain amino acid transport system permease protein
VRGRPRLYVSYDEEQSLLPTWTQKIGVAVLVVFLVILIPLQVVPGLRFLGDSDWMTLLGLVCIFAIGALGLHILSGLGGQVSLGHAFFMGLGAYTAAVLGGETGKELIGFGLPMWVWLPAAGLVAALVGLLVAPTAVRVRGIYLAIVTLGLVFIGEWLFINLGRVTGGSQSGRRFPNIELRLWGEEGEPLVDFTADGPWFGVEMSGETKTYLLLFGLLVLFALFAKNIQRSRVGRAFMAIRDRDIAAEVMGVAEARNKALAFAISSFYAGVCGALWATFIGRIIPEGFSLFLSVQFLAILLIGGLGSITGTLGGAVFVTLLPRIVDDFTRLMGNTAEGEGIFSRLADLVVSTEVGDFGVISTLAGTSPGLTIFQFNLVLYGLLLIVFLIFEPLGLFGIWVRMKNYWKSWPFTY